MTLPCRWADGGLPDFTGRVRFRRRFGYPGRIDEYERVWLTFAGVEGSAEVMLNGHLLGREEGGPFEYEVASLLQPRNELIVEVEGPTTGGLWGEVALEVRRTAFLRSVQVSVDCTGEEARLTVRGEVVGSAERPLEIYVVLDRSTAAYGLVEAALEGQQFQLQSEPLRPEQQTGEHHNVCVDLVDAASVWYTVEQAIDFRSL